MDTGVLFVIFSIILNTVRSGRHDKYAGYTIHGIHLQGVQDQHILNELKHKLNLDILQHGLPRDRPSMVMLSPEQADVVLNELDRYGIEHYLDVADVAKNLLEYDQNLINYRRSRSEQLMPFEDYPTHDEINAYLERVAAQYPNIVTLVTAGQSWENRDIKYLKISTTNFEDSSKPIYFMMAMLHAREWVTSPVALHSIHRLVEDLRDEDKDLLEGTDWIILPMTNPDGYEHSIAEDRYWRRTRSNRTEISTICVGVDGNRNFDALYQNTPDPCSQTFSGPYAFSEPETRVIRDVLQDHVHRIQVHLDIHSHGNYVLYPWGDGTLTPNAAQLHHVGSIMGAAIDTMKMPNAGFYRVGNSAQILYYATGACDDYAQMVGVPLAFTLELPGYGNGFLVPPEFIEHINAETWLGIGASARVAKMYYNLRIRE